MTIGIVAPKNLRQLFALHSTYQFLSKPPFSNMGSVVFLNESDLLSPSLAYNFSLLAFPPSLGDDTPYKFFLNDPNIVYNIEKFSQNKPIIGFCSGAYVFLKDINYLHANGTKNQYNGYVPIVDIATIGPYNPDLISTEGDDYQSQIIPTRFNGSSGEDVANAYYHSGPVFSSTDIASNSNVKSIAKFPDGNTCLMVQFTKNSAIILSSILPQIKYSDFPPDNSSLEKQLLEKTHINLDVLCHHIYEICALKL